MFNTPFLGLSAMVHVLVIFWNRLFSWVPKKEWRKKNSGKMGRLSGFAIIGGVFLIVLINATILVRSSLLDKHSTLGFISEYVGQAFASSSRSSDIASAEGSLASTSSAAIAQPLADDMSAPTNLRFIQEIAPEDCTGPFNQLAVPYQGSLINYLANRYGDYSPGFVKELAIELDVPDYTGTADQNEAMLMRLFIKNGEMPAPGSIYCK